MEFSDADFKNIHTNSVCVFLFYTKSCPPCKISIRTLQELSHITELNSTSIYFHIVNGLNNPFLVKKFNVKSVPTVVMHHSSNNRYILQSGILSYSEFEHMFDEILKEN